ncbi:MAG: heavy metal sensor histidine kinase [Bryobacteraceae bacterium]|nr:heavy metal sensor histidine kinase [Bryobacteraceae bacterium]
MSLPAPGPEPGPGPEPTPAPQAGGQITKWLRFRLAASYVLFVSLLLTGVGALFRQVLGSILNDQVTEILEEEWGAMRGYMKIQRERPVWTYDRDDPEQAFIVERLRRILLIAGSSGAPLEISAQFALLEREPPESVRERLKSGRSGLEIRRGPGGVPYLVRYGVVIDEKKPYFVAIGRSLAGNSAVLRRFTTYYFASLPAIILASALLGWFVSKRALTPLTELARSTEAISSSNLNVRLPSRGAGDELDHLVATFNRMVGRLEESFRQTRQFSTDVSHELRTPLTVIRGQLEVAMMTANSTEQYREAILQALDGVERLSNTVRALLHLSQAESGQLTLQKTGVDLRSMAADMCEQFRVLAEAGRVSLETRLSDCVVEADRLQMERLLSNLLSNAIKYTPAGGEVRVEVARRGPEAEIVVADTGQGIPEEALPHIFDRFYRVPQAAADPEKGLGLGLSFVAWIVRAHGGRIDVQSALGRGTRFTVRLPGAKAPVAAKVWEEKEVYGV